VIESERDLIVRTFVDECAEHLAALEQALVALERAPGDAGLLNEIFRSVHTIKGGAGSLGFNKLAGFAHVLEDVLDAFRAGRMKLDTSLVTVLLRSLDVLRDLVDVDVGGREPTSTAAAAVEEELRSLVPARDVAPAAPSELAQAPDLAPTRLHRSLRVQLDKLDKMLTVAGETAVALGRLGGMVARRAPHELLQEALREAEHLHLDLQELVTRARMVPVGPMFRSFHRTVRDLSLARGRKAVLVIEGEDVELDNTVIEAMHEPFVHMIRNAIDHGLEAPEARRAAGKPETATLCLAAIHRSGHVELRLSDDGAGLDRARILARARERGLLADGTVPAEAEILRLILLPGFSTAEKVGELSGRGVGMDVVRRSVESLRGVLLIDSEPGAGTTLTIRLPLTMSIIEGLTVEVGAETYVLPLDSVVECVELPAAQRSRELAGVIDLRGEPLPYLRLRRWFAVDGDLPRRENVVVIRHGDRQAGVAVDTLTGDAQTVIRPLGSLFQDLPGVTGSAILSDGRVALILDPAAILDDAVIQAQATDA
jgi:two-component system chemotaxis sensor kinase CheA